MVSCTDENNELFMGERKLFDEKTVLIRLRIVLERQLSDNYVRIYHSPESVSTTYQTIAPKFCKKDDDHPG
jgi:hypothetical protein